MAALLIILGILALLIIIFIAIYNSFIVRRNRIDNSFSQIDVQLKRRSELIPKLLEVVKGYAKYERGLFKEITEARTAMLKASSIKEKASADANLSKGIKTLFAVAESYPNLKANQNFLALQEEISATENKIAYARQFYNDTVMEYNTMAERFPSSIIASTFSFKKREFFKAEESAKRDVKVSLPE
jgi:LemA protein